MDDYSETQNKNIWNIETTNHPSITKVKKSSGMALKNSYHPNNMSNKITNIYFLYS